MEHQLGGAFSPMVGLPVGQEGKFSVLVDYGWVAFLKVSEFTFKCPPCAIYSTKCLTNTRRSFNLIFVTIRNSRFYHDSRFSFAVECVSFLIYFCVKGKVAEGWRDRLRQTFHPPTHSLNSCDSWGWPKLKLSGGCLRPKYLLLPGFPGCASAGGWVRTQSQAPQSHCETQAYQAAAPEHFSSSSSPFQMRKVRLGGVQ